MKLSIFASALLAIAPIAVHSHGVEVHYCITSDGQNIRAFVEHWHNVNNGEITVPTDAGEMDITNNLDGTSALYNATGLVNNVEPDDLWRQSRCRENFTTKVSECVGTNNIYNTKNWVYYDFPLECDVLASFTFNEGLTIVLENGCTQQADGGTYPALIQGVFECGTAAPTVDPSGDCDPTPGFECVQGSFVNGVGTCGEGIAAGYYPDLTNKNGYCKCTGTAAPSRYEQCPHGLHWDTLHWSYIPGNDGAVTDLGQGGYWGTIGGICNWPAAVSAQTRQRPPWTNRRKLSDCEEPTDAPTPTPDGDSFCVEGAYINGVGTCPDGIQDGYYPDLTNFNGYCKCTGTAAPSRYEKCPSGLYWDSVNWAYLSGTAPSGAPLGPGGLWATIGGICNYPGAVSAQTMQRPPYRRRNLRSSN